MKTIILLIGTLFLFTEFVFASSVDIHGATDDTYINNHSAHDDQNWNSGHYSQLSLTNCNPSGDGVHDLVIKFDISPYIGQTIQSATINLYRVVPVWGYTIDLYRKNIDISYFNGSWSENTITWNNAPSSTYVKRMNLGNDDSLFNCWVPVDITDIADLWLSGTVQNNGIRMHVPQIVNSNFWTFQDSEESTNVPYLTLTFADPEPQAIPEPATVVLISLSALGLIRRKIKG